MIGEIFVAVLAAVLGAYVSFLLEHKASKQKIEQVKNSYKLPPPIPIEIK